MGNRRKSPVEIETVPAFLCSIDLRLQILSGVPFLASLSAAEIARANESFHTFDYAEGDTIYFSGDPAGHLYVIASGQVRLTQHSEAGKDVLLDVLKPGDFFGSLTPGGDEPYAETAQAQSAACIMAITAADFRALMTTYPRIAPTILDLTAGRLQMARETVRQLTAFSTEQRIAAVLVHLAEKLGDQQTDGLLIQTRLSREDLAQMTGATPETVSRIMAQLQKDGLISSGRQWVAINDLEALAELADG
jgi:CRP-like cAMP-binding protein